MIGGTMGVGKTTVCKILRDKLPNSVFLDGDWCWNMNPFQVTEETKAMVMSNICYLLNNYIHCSAYENVIFGWVMHEQSTIDTILSRIDISTCDVKCISLICNENSLVQRLQADVDKGIRKYDVIERSVFRIPLYDSLNTIKIDVSQIKALQVAEKIMEL